SHRFDDPRIDGYASIAIGVVLMVVAVFLVYESKGLLIGEGVEPGALDDMRSIAQSDPDVQKAERPLTVFLGPEEVVLALELDFRKEAQTTDIERSVQRIEDALRRKYPIVKRIYIETRHLGGRRETEARRVEGMRRD